MSIHINQNKKISSMFVNVNGEKKNIVSIWVDGGNNTPARVFGSGISGVHEIAPGLYDENDVLVASAEDLENIYKFDIAKNYYSYKTDETSLYNILNNNEELSNGVKLVIPDNVTVIGAYAFRDCTQLKSIVLPNALEKMGSSTVYGCSNLEELTVPISYKFDKYNYIDNNPKLSHFIITKGTGVSVEYSSYSEYEYTPWHIQTHNFTVKIKDGVNRIGNMTFENCSYLVNIEMAESIVEIGDSAFYNCVSLTTNLNALLPEKLELLGKKAFYGCKNVMEENVIIPPKITEIPDDCFYMTNINFGRTCILPEKLTYIGSNSFSNWICETIGPVGSGCDIEIPSTVTGIGQGVFASNTNLKAVNLPYGIESLGIGVFRNCKSLYDVFLPDSLKSMSNNVFASCTSLNDLYIPVSVILIKIKNYTNAILYECSNARIYCGAISKPSDWSTDWNAYGYNKKILYNITYWGISRETYESTYKQ